MPLALAAAATAPNSIHFIAREQTVEAVHRDALKPFYF
jgi:hypothetical protein